MKFSRIDLADCVTPEALLAEIHKLQGGMFPIPVPIHEWALALDISAINALETEGFQGGLMMFPDRSAGTILVSEAADYRRQRFTVGHELAHFLLPWHTPRSGQGFLCSSKDMAVFQAKAGGDRYTEMEAQANRFSAGILMPAAPFRTDLRARRQFEVSHIAELADRYEVSKEAMARRCADLHDDAIGIVFSRAGVVVRAYRGKDFPRLAVGANDPLPAGSVARRAILAPGQSSAWDEVPADRWLHTRRGTVSEQTLGQKNGFRMTLLTSEAESDDLDDDEEVERAWTPPQFNRR